LQKGLGENFLVELAMRYGNPTIERAIGNLLQHDLSSLLILPLFPQYASATSGSVHQRTMEVLKQFQVIPRVTFMQNFFDHHLFIDAFADIAQSYPLDQYDHILFSYHGLPEGQIKKRDRHQHCLRSLQCCEQMSLINRDCYAAQCFATTQALVSKLNLSSSQYSLCFQSRLGKQPWLQPYASDRIKTLAAQGSKRLLVFCPSFVCDCLETIYEFGVEYAAEFKHAGGERLDLVPGLNAHPKWIEALKAIVLSPLPC
jgi:ferrochelatase